MVDFINFMIHHSTVPIVEFSMLRRVIYGDLFIIPCEPNREFKDRLDLIVKDMKLLEEISYRVNNWA